jgi:hypothetical protein
MRKEVGMRSASLFFLLLALIGISSAQDTNFPVGPQYLMNFGSPMFLRPIATPTLSLSAPPPSTFTSLTSLAQEAASAQSSTAPGYADLSEQAAKDRIYWGVVPVTESVSENAGQNSTNNVSEIEISSAQTPGNLPDSIVNAGVIRMVDAQSLSHSGYGIPLGEAAAFWKAHESRAARVYTNADVKRLHGD